MPPNTRPGEDPADIVDGTRKRKATERSMLAKDLAIGPKKLKATIITSGVPGLASGREPGQASHK